MHITVLIVKMGSSVSQGFCEVSLLMFFIVIITGQKISEAIFLPSILPIHEGKRITLVSKRGQIKKTHINIRLRISNWDVS